MNQAQPMLRRTGLLIAGCYALIAAGCQLPAPLTAHTTPSGPGTASPASPSQASGSQVPPGTAQATAAHLGHPQTHTVTPVAYQQQVPSQQMVTQQPSPNYVGTLPAHMATVQPTAHAIGTHVRTQATHTAGTPCTAGCCGTAAPCYPTMPPASAFGLDPQEFLCDGGDDGPRAMYTQQERIVGVDLEDTVVKYETARGEIEVTPSNRVCVYAPRFASVRRINGAVTGELATGPVAAARLAGPSGIEAPQPSSAVMSPIGPDHQALARGPDGMRSQDFGVRIDNTQAPIMVEDALAALMNLEVVRTGMLQDEDKPWLAKAGLAAQVWSDQLAPEVAIEQVRAETMTRDAEVRGLTTYDLPSGRLRVIKMADRQAAAVGDIVTFVLRVDNVGEGPIHGVELTDNLTTRLEYVPDSQSSTVAADFATSQNDGGSLRLTWKFTESFKVGEGAVVRFQARVR